jgi:hypothetical protein
MTIEFIIELSITENCILLNDNIVGVIISVYVPKYWSQNYDLHWGFLYSGKNVHCSTLLHIVVQSSIASHSPTPFHISLTLHVYNSLLNYRHYEAAVAQSKRLSPLRSWLRHSLRTRVKRVRQCSAESRQGKLIEWVRINIQ